MNPVSFSLFVHASPGGDLSETCEDTRVINFREDGSILLAVLDGCGGV